MNAVVEPVDDSTVEESTDVNVLDMSDEAFQELTFDTSPEPVEDNTEEVVEEVEEESTDIDDIEKELSDEPEEETDDEPDTEMQSEEEEAGEEIPETEDDVVEEETKEVIDPAEQIKELFLPFKANGHDMTVDSVADARTLMQMGANYNKKMAALKPNLKILKMLENNNLLDENKLNYLIDLDRKNPDAITKLVKDSKLDLDDIDTETEKDYKPNTYTVNDKEVELDETLKDISDTESYAKTLNVISNKWDESSKQALLDKPAGIKVLNDHVASGIYDKITAAVETERMFGRIPATMSDLEAYTYVGDAINARGGFNTKTQSKSPAQTSIRKATKQVVDPKLNDRKKAASSTKSSPRSKSKEAFNPLAMSDEEFEKVGLEKFI